MSRTDDFPAIYARLKTILEPYQSRLILKVDEPLNYSLDTPYSEKYGRELFFGAVQVKKNYVSYYLMPVYMFPDLLGSISRGLKQRMQGKSCFNFTRLDNDTFRELAELTERAFERLKQEQIV